MSDSAIKIFYSWQSDLPGNTTRNIIQDGIKDAVKLLRDTVEVEADRDTNGKTGSPDIAQTIFSKIEDCDIFVADVTAVTQMEITNANGETIIKKIPNPNVMLELGYATHVVGWENVICVLNTDYGAIQNMPFDIANRRLTPFSLSDGKSKGDVKRYIRDIIQETVVNIIENGRRVKSGFSDLRIGCLNQGKLENTIIPVKLSESDKYKNFKNETITECMNLYGDLKKLVFPVEEEEIDTNTVEVINKNDKEKGFELLAATLNGSKTIKVSIKPEDQKEMVLYMKKYLGVEIDVNDDIFNFGHLKKRYNLLQSYSYEGTEDEEKKYDLYEQLNFNLIRLDLWERYIKTFDDYLFLPLAIENKSSRSDEDIDVYIQICAEQMEVIYPSESLICSELKGIEGIIYEEDIIKTLLKMGEDSTIGYDDDISFSILDSQAQVRAQLNAGGINGNPRYTSEDYARELKKYIAVPMEDNDNEFWYPIKSLKASEKKWLGPALLLKPLTDNFDISYTIKSKKSDGCLSGVLSYSRNE